MRDTVLVLLGIGVLAIAAYAGIRYMQSSKSAASITTHMQHQDDKNALRVVNVLSEDLFTDARIKGSINVPFDKFEETVKDWDKNMTVVVYCANYACSASGAAAQMLRKQGFTKVFAYEGGTAEWYQRHQADPSFEIEGPAKQDYLVVAVKQAPHTGDFEIISAEKLKELLAQK